MIIAPLHGSCQFLVRENKKVTLERPFSSKATGKIDLNQRESTRPATKVTTVLLPFLVIRMVRLLGSR